MLSCTAPNSGTLSFSCFFYCCRYVGIAAGLGLKAVLLKYPEVNGTVSVLGTPAEEDGGGKIDLIEAGAFANADVALMVHPDRLNMMEPVALAYTPCTVAFTGKAAHAAAAPWEGVNALDAAISAYQSLSMLRQQTEPDCRFHAVIPEGGKRPNIIPESTKMKFIIRSPTNKGIAVLKHKATNIMKAAALASGCDVDITYASPEKAAHYSNMVSNTHLTQCFRKHWESCNPVQSHVSANCIWASTDMGNVSYVVPSIHPTFDIGTSADIHSRDFATAAATHEAHVATLCVAKAMACVGWDVLTDPKFLCQVKETFKEQLSALIGPCSMPACTQLFNST